LKDNVTGIKGSLEKLMKLKGVYFDWKQDDPFVKRLGRKGSDYGFIAQEVFQTVPQVVYENEEGYLGMDYSKLVSISIGALQEHQRKIISLKNKVEKLKTILTNG
jgi:hypothetical protein